MFGSNAREIDIAYRARLTASLDVTRLLLRQGLAFRGHDESANSSNRGSNATGNCKMISPVFQKDLAHACALEIISSIVNEIGEKVFTILVDEARDVSLKEQMGVGLRYVNDKGCVIERFFGIVHVDDTCSHTLKSVIDKLFRIHGLSLSKLRGQGYDGASNMRGEFNGLKALILEENPYVKYIHCFSHQLQLIIVVVAKSIMAVKDLFSYTTMIVNTCGASCKRKDQLRKLEHERIVEELTCEERVGGRGQNQEISLARAGDTRWGSHYFTLLHLCSMWLSVVKVLENVRDDSTCPDAKSTARGLIGKMNNYEFVFVLHLMKYLLGITNELSLALQRKDQNIVQAMSLIDSVKVQLQLFRDDGWEIILNQTNRFCEVNGISLIDMEETITRPGYRCKPSNLITNDHHYRVEIFYELKSDNLLQQVLDLTLQEVENQFSEVGTDLLRCTAYFDPKDSFSRFDVDQIMRLTTIYTEDFSTTDYLYLPQQLCNFIANVRLDSQFSTVDDLGSLALKMVKTGKHLVFPLVYRMIELTLVLPVATASIERAFSAMKIVKTDLRNRMGDKWMNSSLVVYIERSIFSEIENVKILQRYQSMSSRRMHLT